MTSPIAALRAAVGFKIEEVALMAGWSVARQRAIESGEELLAEEADALTALLGADIESMLSSDMAPAHRPLGALLKSQSQKLDARARFALTEATTVAREIQELRSLMGLPTGLGNVGRFASSSDYGHPSEGVPERLAGTVRRHLDLGSKPVQSVQRQILEQLGVVLLWVELPAEIDALAFASEESGAVIVANPRGTHMTTAYGRRIALAHEVCHLLFDRHEMARFVRACSIERGLVGVHRDWFERVERRARAFALYLLAPSTAVAERWRQTQGRQDSERVLDVMRTFGIGYEAARGHLAHLGCLHFRVEILGVPTQTEASWEAADPAPDHRGSRAGVLAQIAKAALQAGRISERRAQELERGPLRSPGAWSPMAQSYRTTSMGEEPSP